jgi:hypothetical protein
MTISEGPPERLIASIWLCVITESIHECWCATSTRAMLMWQFIWAIPVSFAALREFFVELG